MDETLTRSRFIRAGLAGIASFALFSCGSRQERAVEGVQAGRSLPKTPSCPDDDKPEVTASNSEGPFYTPDSPQRSNLREAGLAGTNLVVAGRVFSTNCRPVAGALLDFWQADDEGEYDNEGFTLRGHQFTDESGDYRLETIVPGLYPGRTRHIHVKAQAPNEPVLTTQLYFPDEPRNAQDSIFLPALIMPVEKLEDGWHAAFDFVLETGSL